MKNKPSKDFFWMSYSDLLTSLFFIMLVLFVLVFYMLNMRVVATEEALEKIQNIQRSVEYLPKEYFEFDSTYRRFNLREPVNFAKKSSVIPSDSKPYLRAVGNSIRTLVDTLSHNPDYKDVKYMVVIEGMASKDSYIYNYELSYERALSLYRFWQSEGIRFNPSICEVQIAGSGIGGVGRYGYEPKNQRFIVQVIPKIADQKILLTP